MGGQQMAILVLAGLFVALSLIQWIRGPASRRQQVDEKPKGSYLETGQTIYQNPQLAWYERYFCRGYQRSDFCSFRLLHPFKDLLESNGIEVKEEPPSRGMKVNEDYTLAVANPADDPLSYRGVTREKTSIPGRSLRGKITLDGY